jgi:hypothetical protein
MDQPAQPAAAQATSDPASVPPAPPIPLERPATTSASGPISISPGDSTEPSPRIKVPAIKPQRASASGAATDQSAQQGAQKAPQASPALSIQAPAPQASLSAQTSNQGAATRSVPTPAWPDPPLLGSKLPNPLRLRVIPERNSPNPRWTLRCPTMRKALPGAVHRPQTPPERRPLRR